MPLACKESRTIDALEIAQTARSIAEDRKGADIVLLDLRRSSSVTDYTLLISGSSPPHLKALFGGIDSTLKKKGVQAFRKAGTPESGWLVLDYVDLVIHVLSIANREYYAIDQLWAEATPLE